MTEVLQDAWTRFAIAFAKLALIASFALPPAGAVSSDEYLQNGIALYKRGERNYNERDLYEAVASLSWALKKFPRNGEAFRYRGSAHALLGYMGLAHRDLHCAVALEPNYAHAWNDLAAVHYMLGLYRDALKECDKSISLDSKFAEAYRHKGEVLSVFGKHKEALQFSDKAIALAPGDAENFTSRARVFMDTRQWVNAVRDCTEAIKLNPRNKTAWYYRGTCRIHLKQDKDAISDFDRALAIDPRYAGCYANRAIALHKLGRTKEAESDLNVALRLNPRDAGSLDNRGFLKEEQGKHSEAVADFTASLKLSPDPHTYHHRAKSNEARGYSKKALDDWDLALKLAPDYEDAYLARQSAQIDLSRYETILSKMDRATQSVASERKSGDSAISRYTRQLNANPSNKDALYLRANCYMASGQFAEASKDFQTYIERHGWNDERSIWSAMSGHLALRHLQDDKRAAAIIKTASKHATNGGWAADILKYLDHQVSADALLERADNSIRRTTAEYFIGATLSLSGLKERARRYLSSVQARGDSNSPTYQAALRELNALDNTNDNR